MVSKPSDWSVLLKLNSPFQPTSPTSGPPAVSVTLTAATGPTSSRRTLTVGSGPQTRLASLPLTVAQLSTTGAPPGASTHPGPSLTTGSRSSRAGSPSPASPSSTTSMETVSSSSHSDVSLSSQYYSPSGIKWHDVACHHEKPIICEDVEGHLAFARQTFPNIRIP